MNLRDDLTQNLQATGLFGAAMGDAQMAGREERNHPGRRMSSKTQPALVVTFSRSMLAQPTRTAVYGPVRTVVWQGSAGDRRPYADLVVGYPEVILEPDLPADKLPVRRRRLGPDPTDSRHSPEIPHPPPAHARSQNSRHPKPRTRPPLPTHPIAQTGASAFATEIPSRAPYHPAIPRSTPYETPPAQSHSRKLPSSPIQSPATSSAKPPPPCSLNTPQPPAAPQTKRSTQY